MRSFLVLLGSLAVLGGAPPASRVGAGGVSIALPRGWHAIPYTTPGLDRSDPVTRIAAASGPLTFGRGCGPTVYAFPPTAAAVVVVEWVRPTPQARFAPRPHRFSAATLPVRPPPALECFDGRGGSTQFVDHGRRFAVYVMLGRRAPAALAARARAVLDTLIVKRRA